MADIRIADISQWQANIDAPAQLKAGYKTIICRTHSGHRADSKMPARRDYLRKAGFVGIGWYHYLAASNDAAAQARAFIQTVGQLKANEWPILDVEEGSGSQTARAEAWFKIVDAWAGFPAMLYASTSFVESKLSGYAHWKRPLWLARYTNSRSDAKSAEPSGPHALWQYSDRSTMPGIGHPVDASIARDITHADFLAKVRGGKSAAPSPPPAPPPRPEEMLDAVLKRDGRLVVFAQRSNGEVLQAYQTAVNGGWSGADKGQRAKWYSLGNPGK